MDGQFAGDGQGLEGVVDDRVVLDSRDNGLTTRQDSAEGDGLVSWVDEYGGTHFSTLATEITSMPFPGLEVYQEPEEPCMEG